MLFNQYGVPENQEIKDVEADIHTQVNDLFNSLLKQGITAIEIRAVGEYLGGVVSCCTSGAVLDLRYRVYKEYLDKLAPLSQHEIDFLKANPTGVNKLEAIRQYMNRLSCSLHDAKEAVELWIKNNHEPVSAR